MDHKTGMAGHKLKLGTRGSFSRRTLHLKVFRSPPLPHTSWPCVAACCVCGSELLMPPTHFLSWLTSASALQCEAASSSTVSVTKLHR
jgi:hypothetical protein